MSGEVRQTPRVHMVYVRLLTVLPIALGVWSMALVLWQPSEYYYYCHNSYLPHGICSVCAGRKQQRTSTEKL